MAQQGQLIRAIKAKSGMTVAYSNGGGFWKTRYSFLPSCYGWVDRVMITGREYFNSAELIGFIDTDLFDDRDWETPPIGISYRHP